MSGALRHRGPNGHGYLVAPASGPVRVIHGRAPEPAEEAGGTVGFAHRRLSIFDLSEASAQPMSTADGTLSVLYNGALYNWRELRKEMESGGVRFSTEGDTEVVLRAYEYWGLACVERFAGMWALAILDMARRRLVLSRDRFGLKPLYVARHRGALYFASEIKGLLAVPGMPRDPLASTVARFLRTGLADIDGGTFFDGIDPFPAAHVATIPLGETPRLELHRFWDFPSSRFDGSEREAIARTRELLSDAVFSHAQADVSVGTCLSGGLDSSSILTLATELRGTGQLPHYAHEAFGYVPGDARWSEQRYMEQVAGATGVAMHYVRCGDEKFMRSLEQVVTQQDEPFGTASIVVQWLVFEAARERGITVMLDGQGADETLGGYHHYLSSIALHHLHRGQIGAFLAFRRAYRREIGDFPFGWRTAAQVAAPAGLRRAASRVRRPWRTRMSASAASGLPIARPALADASREESYGSAADDLDAILRQQVRSISLPALLRFEDRNSMAHGIEARVPFLDHRLVDFLFTVPGDLKIKGARTKHLLREAMRGSLPEPVRDRRDKIGFKASPSLTVGYARRYAAVLAENVTELERQWFDESAVRMVLEGTDGSSASEFASWRIINVKLWLRGLCGARS